MAFLIFIQLLKKFLFANSVESYQTPRFFASSDLVLHSLTMSHKKDARLIWVNNTVMILSLRSRYCTDLDGKK